MSRDQIVTHSRNRLLWKNTVFKKVNQLQKWLYDVIWCLYVFYVELLILISLFLGCNGEKGWLWKRISWTVLILSTNQQNLLGEHFMVELSPEIPVIAIEDKIHHHQLRMAQTTTQVLHPLEGGSLVIAHFFIRELGKWSSMTFLSTEKLTCN